MSLITCKRATVMVVVLVSAMCAAALIASADGATQRGQWATTASIQRMLVGNPFDLIACDENPCSVLVYNGQASLPPDYFHIKVNVRSAAVRGIGSSRIIRGQRRYQQFNVHICAIDYVQGGAKVSATFLWHTRGSFDEEPGAFDEDWTYRKVHAPTLAHDGC